ncbi:MULTISPECIES: hypothetical protein [unclassified Megasphaera]|jgi:hypothetical protein|uniref:hypothetical protein n=1 Tax=unclassified Megasphaera TaxID=2626256 RepID=UPI000EDF2A6D|nr:hypothetical protein [Megasphaera sp. UBA4233]DAQ24413.1 MAG TPA: minor structural protein [Caudoviricetes sp.]DAZ36384.1 MAG TPA: minor structural protein [Caudoviricetes sp.]HAM04949.1 hypothetical protein [Megasphaera sp.]
MAYTLQQIYEALSKIENGGTMVADLQDAISKVRAEAATNRVSRNKVLDALGLRDGENIDENLRNLTATLDIVRKIGDPQQMGTQMASMQKQIKELTDKYTASEKLAAEEKAKRIQSTMKSQITAALTDGKAVKPDVFAQVLLGNVSAKEDGSLIFKDGDKEVSIADGVKGWLEANPWAVKNDSHPGSGQGGGGSHHGAYTMDELKGMSRAEINQHWDEISKGVKK